MANQESHVVTDKTQSGSKPGVSASSISNVPVSGVFKLKWGQQQKSQGFETAGVTWMLDVNAANVMCFKMYLQLFPVSEMHLPIIFN